jgi:hypothetical protein
MFVQSIRYRNNKCGSPLHDSGSSVQLILAFQIFQDGIISNYSLSDQDDA